MTLLKLFAWAITGAVVFAIAGCASPSKKLVLRNAKEEKVILLSDLVNSKLAETVQVESDPAYGGRTMTYQAIPMNALFKDFKFDEGQTLQFICLDGFAGPIAAERVLKNSKSESMAYLAIENPERPWPPLKGKDGPTAGPFYLIWKNPARSKIKIEEWPYQLASFEFKKSVAEEFPKLVPVSKSSGGPSVEKGFRLFVQNCFACHTLNGEGHSQLGPDLNLPKSPIEYFNKKYLENFIRNPQEVRHWPNGKMKGFDAAALSEKEIRDIINYLEHMARHRNQKSR